MSDKNILKVGLALNYSSPNITGAFYNISKKELKIHKFENIEELKVYLNNQIGINEIHINVDSFYDIDVKENLGSCVDKINSIKANVRYFSLLSKESQAIYFVMI